MTRFNPSGDFFFCVSGDSFRSDMTFWNIDSPGVFPTRKKGPRDLKIRRTLKGANHCRVPSSTSQQSHKAYKNYRLLNVPAEKRSYEQPHQRLRSKTPHSPFSRTSIRAGPCADTTLRNALGTTSVIVVLFILSVNSEPIFAFIFLI